MSNKCKSHSGAKKRFTLTGNGLIKYTKKGRRHILTKKSSKTKRKMRLNSYISKCDEVHIKRLIISH